MNMLLLALTTVAALAACVAAVCAWAALRKAGQPVAAPAEITERLLLLSDAARRAPEDAAALRQEVIQSILRIGEEQNRTFADFRDQMTGSHARAVEAFGESSKQLKEHQGERLNELRDQQGDRLTTLARNMADLAERLERQGKEAREALTAGLETARKEMEGRQEKMRETLTENLATLRKENETKLEQMRATVDEKLQGTLEARLGESFKLVGDRLESVQKGLGEMQQLATGVGDLKRVLTNVKSRGTWGEVQLGALLEDMLTPDQYAAQVKVQPDRGEVVDYAVNLPGGSDGRALLLPIDCKFPHEDYDRLLAAQEGGDLAAVEIAGKALERAIRIQAKSINEKYVHPPASTNFAIMYLPTEGLFAEVVRRPGLVGDLQQNCRVTVTGPTTLAALLNSLRMGFTTLAIQKRSSEVWTVLGEAKKAFMEYGAAFDAVDKKLDEAKKKVADVGVRHRAVTRKLRGVETLEIADAGEGSSKLLSLAGLPDEEDAAA